MRDWHKMAETFAALAAKTAPPDARELLLENVEIARKAANWHARRLE